MKKNLKINNKGLIDVQILQKESSVSIDLDKEACQFLIDELTKLLQDQNYTIEYDSGTGRDCKILTYISKELYITRRN